MPNDQPTGPEQADAVAARMPGWKRVSEGEGLFRDAAGRDHWTGPSPYPYARMFRPQQNVADAMEVMGALGMIMDIRRQYVWCHRPGACYCSADIPRAGRTLAQAVCDAVCDVAVQLPKVAEAS